MIDWRQLILNFGKFSFLLDLFLQISQIHLHINPQLGSVENIFWLGAVGAATLNYKIIRPLHLLLIFLMFALVLSGLINGSSSELILQVNYKYTLMAIAFTLSGLLLFSSAEDYKKLEWCFLSASAVLVGVFLYRYLILNEIREFDGRPVLNLRNGDPNFLAFIFCLAFFLGLELKRTWIKYSALFIFGAAVFITQSRMGVVSLIAGSGVLLFKKFGGNRRQQVLFISACLGLVVLTLFAFPELLLRFENILDRSNLERVKTWANGWQLFITNPWLGVGLDSSEKFYFKTQGYPLFQSLEDPITVHNAYLKMLSEIGLVGSLPLLAWQTGLFWRAQCSKITLEKTLVGVIIFNSFFIGIAFKDFYLLGLCLIEQRQLTRGLA